MLRSAVEREFVVIGEATNRVAHIPSPLMGEGQGEGEPGNPPTLLTNPVPKPESPTSFQTACRAIAAVRNAKHEAQVGLGKPLATLTITATTDQLDLLKPVAADVADAGGAPQITHNPAETDDGYVATVVAPL